MQIKDIVKTISLDGILKKYFYDMECINEKL